MGSKNYHVPVVGGADVRTEINTALGALDAAIGGIGVVKSALFGLGGDEVGLGSSNNATWNDHEIEGLEVDPYGIVVPDALFPRTDFVPEAGRYLLMCKGAAMHGTGSGHRLRLYNVTQASVVDEGLGAYARDSWSYVSMKTIFTANGTDEYKVEHYTVLGEASGVGYKFNGAGIGGVDGDQSNFILMRIG